MILCNASYKNSSFLNRHRDPDITLFTLLFNHTSVVQKHEDRVGITCMCRLYCRRPSLQHCIFPPVPFRWYPSPASSFDDAWLAGKDARHSNRERIPSFKGESLSDASMDRRMNSALGFRACEKCETQEPANDISPKRSNKNHQRPAGTSFPSLV